MLTTLIKPVPMALGSEDGEVPRHNPFVVTLGDSDRTKLEVRVRKYTSLYLLSGPQFDYTRRAVQESWAGTHVGHSHCDDDPEARRVVRQRGRRDQRVRGLTVSLAGGLVLIASGFLLVPSTRWLEHGIWTAGWPDAAWVLWRQRLRPS